MAWGNAANVVTTNLDAGTDSPATARSDIKAAMDELSAVINGRGTTDGVASLDSTGRVPIAQLLHEAGTSFPVATSLPYGYRVFRTDLGEWFTLMDATVWGGSGKAWVGDQSFPFGFGRNVSSGTSGVYLAGFGSAGNLDASRGIAIDVDMLIVAATMISAQSMTGTIVIRNASTDLVTFTFTAQTQQSMSRAASAWKRIDAGGILTVGPSTMTSGQMDDPIIAGMMRRVINA